MQICILAVVCRGNAATFTKTQLICAGLSPVDTVRLARAVLQAGPLGKARSTLVMWLLDAMDANKQVLQRSCAYG